MFNQSAKLADATHLSNSAMIKSAHSITSVAYGFPNIQFKPSNLCRTKYKPYLSRNNKVRDVHWSTTQANAPFHMHAIPLSKLSSSNSIAKHSTPQANLAGWTSVQLAGSIPHYSSSKTLCNCIAHTFSPMKKPVQGLKLTQDLGPMKGRGGVSSYVPFKPAWCNRNYWDPGPGGADVGGVDTGVAASAPLSTSGVLEGGCSVAGGST